MVYTLYTPRTEYMESIAPWFRMLPIVRDCQFAALKKYFKIVTSHPSFSNFKCCWWEWSEIWFFLFFISTLYNESETKRNKIWQNDFSKKIMWLQIYPGLGYSKLWVTLCFGLLVIPEKNNWVAIMIYSWQHQSEMLPDSTIFWSHENY